MSDIISFNFTAFEDNAVYTSGYDIIDLYKSRKQCDLDLSILELFIYKFAYIHNCDLIEFIDRVEEAELDSLIISNYLSYNDSTCCFTDCCIHHNGEFLSDLDSLIKHFYYYLDFKDYFENDKEAINLKNFCFCDFKTSDSKTKYFFALIDFYVKFAITYCKLNRDFDKIRECRDSLLDISLNDKEDDIDMEPIKKAIDNLVLEFKKIQSNGDDNNDKK